MVLNTSKNCTLSKRLILSTASISELKVDDGTVWETGSPETLLIRFPFSVHNIRREEEMSAGSLDRLLILGLASFKPNVISLYGTYPFVSTVEKILDSKTKSSPCLQCCWTSKIISSSCSNFSAADSMSNISSLKKSVWLSVQGKASNLGSGKERSKSPKEISRINGMWNKQKPHTPAINFLNVLNEHTMTKAQRMCITTAINICHITITFATAAKNSSMGKWRNANTSLWFH